MVANPHGYQWAECPECGAVHWMRIYNVRVTEDGRYVFDFKEHDAWCEHCRELLFWDRLPDSRE